MTAENMLPCSVTASAGIFSSTARSSSSSIAAGAVEQRELGVQVQMDEFGSSCGPHLDLDRVLDRHSHSIVAGGFELMS